MNFFKDFDLDNSKQNYHIIKYKNETFIQIKKSILKNFVHTILLTSKENQDEANNRHKKARKLLSIYNDKKKKYYNNSRIKLLTPSDKDFKFFEQAIDIIDNHKIDMERFLQINIERLEFANTFPKPVQLATNASEECILKFKKEKDKEVILTVKDRDTKLQENERFKESYKKMKDGNATILDAKYVIKLMEFKNKQVPPSFIKFLESME